MAQTLLLFIGGIGTSELILIALILLVLFGGRKIPELMRGIGKGIREFNAAKNNIETEIKEGIREEDRKVNPRLEEK